MEGFPHIGTASDLEQRAALVADPGGDIRVRCHTASELRELVDTVRDAEAVRVFPHMISVLLDLLRTTEPALHKGPQDSPNPEWQFRRLLIEILHRIATSEASRNQLSVLMSGMFYILRHDNEENGVTACKAIVDIIRTFRQVTEEILSEFLEILRDMFFNFQSMVDEMLSETSQKQDPRQLLPSMRSFRVLAEMGIVVVTFSQSVGQRQNLLARIQAIIQDTFDAVCVESPAQKHARESYEAMGGYWSGMAPTVPNPQAYGDYITAQIKACLASRLWHLRSEMYMDKLITVSLRILQDIPESALAPRRDFMVVFRHFLSTRHRKSILPQIDKLFDEDVLLGRGAATKESLRANAYAALADLIHHIRGDLSMQHVSPAIKVFSRLFHNPSLSCNVQVVVGKMLFGLVDTVVQKENATDVAKILTLLVEISVDRLESVTSVLPELIERSERSKKGEEDTTLLTTIEKARPVVIAHLGVGGVADCGLLDSRLLIRTCVHGFRVCFAALKKLDGTVPDGTVVARFFTGCIDGLVLYEDGTREYIDVLDGITQAFLEIDPHVIQEVWTQRMDYFFERARKYPHITALCQHLYPKEAISPTLIAVVLEYLVDRLPQLGEDDDQTAVMTIRLFKLTFSSIPALPATNEPILAHHLPRLITESFALASKSSRPASYYHLLRGLFRAIGGGGGRLELLYKEVLPILPEMLESLNQQLMLSDGYSRDMIVELCLTVPLRLTHLIPHLSYLMKPLALALRGTPELITQGLRTLELCIDNLTPDFLDPTLQIVLPELMAALQNLLRPLPANHQHSHTALRILGKLGGRSRRLLDREPELDFEYLTEPTKVLVNLGRDFEGIELGRMVNLAARALKKGEGDYTIPAFEYVDNCATLLINDGARGRNREEVLERSLEALFDAVRIPSLKERAQASLRDISSTTLANEVHRSVSQDMTTRRTHYATSVFTRFLNSLAYALSLEGGNSTAPVALFVKALIEDFVASLRTTGDPARDNEVAFVFHHLSRRFSTLALEEGWVRKKACCTGFMILFDVPGVDTKWVEDRELEFVRTLLFILKDMPSESPQNVEHVTALLMSVLRLCHGPIIEDSPSDSRPRFAQLLAIFVSDLSSPNVIVRRAVEQSLDLIGELVEHSVTNLLSPGRDRMLQSIYTKPLRALPFAMQIGMIDAMRYVVSLNPPLPVLNDEFLRLLHEALALADAEDGTLIGRGNARQSTRDVMRLRVACIRLLTAAMPLTDFFSKQTNTRQKVTGVYFKSLYSPSIEVKEAAHEGLRIILAHQSRLPKELLQTGLRPILMNLADPKRLSVAGLEGLARLLELLTNYFKVEIGSKLLDHFRIVADPQMLQASSKSPLLSNEGITKLVRLTHIFHLLPAAANVFLEPLVNAIVQTEAQMHCSSKSPFSEPLAKFLQRYPVEAVDFLLKNIQLPRVVRTYRSILQARFSPAVQQELMARTSYLIMHCLSGNNTALLLPGLSIFQDLAELDPTWFFYYPHVVDALIEVWRRILPTIAGEPSSNLTVTVKCHQIVLSLFMKVFEVCPRVDIPFEIITVFVRTLPIDLVRTTRWLYDRVAFNEDSFFQRSLFYRFLLRFPEESWPSECKTHFIRLVILPMIVYRSKSPTGDALLDTVIIEHIHKRIWAPMSSDRNPFADADHLFSIELLHLSTILIQTYPALVEPARRDVIRCAWNYITSEDSIVRQSAYLLAANFFCAYDTPEKFILRAWTGLLKPPHFEGRTLVRRALDILAPSLPRCHTQEGGYPVWAKTTRRLLAEESHGQSQLIMVYQIIVRQHDLFYPVRSLFVPHMVNSLSKLGLHGTTSSEARLLSIELMQTIFDWEQRAASETEQSTGHWLTPLPYRESVVSYLVRLATAASIDPQSRVTFAPRAFNLLRSIVGPNGWKDVTVKLNYFSRILEQGDFGNAEFLTQALSFAKVLQIVAADKPDSWYTDAENAIVLQRLIRKGMLSDDALVQDALHPIFDRLVQIFPLSKEDEEQSSQMAEFHRFVHSSISDGLQNATSTRGVLLMLKSVVDVTPERIESFSSSTIKLLGKLAKDHFSTQNSTPSFDATVRLLMTLLDICQVTMSHLGEQRRFFTMSLVTLVEKSKSPTLCKYLLEIGRTWAFQKNEPYLPMNEKAKFLQRMASFETRSEPLFTLYLQLVYDIYTEPSLRRSDLTVKLEHSFLLGCRATNVSLREKFIDLLDVSVPRTLSNRLIYILGVQSWEPLADRYWIPIALHLLIGALDPDPIQRMERKVSPIYPSGPPLPQRRLGDLFKPMQRLLASEPSIAHDIWMSVFPAAWISLSRREQVDATHHLISLLSREYHGRQAENCPNIIQTLLSSFNLCSPPITLPPHLVKYLAKTFGAWHAGMEYLQAMNQNIDEDPAIRETIPDSLAELYAELAEEDLFYGLWRRRSLHTDTGIAISFEQNGMWSQASHVYEIAQQKSRAGSLPFSEVEYIFWEDHWILAAEKLQQWEILYDFARGEGNQELMLESAWRTKNWAEQYNDIEEQIAALPEAGTPRRRVYEGFLALLKPTTSTEKSQEFTRVLEDGMQLTLRKWVALPLRLSQAHIPLLQHFQQFVELQEAVQIFGSLVSTNAQNLEKKSADLKMVLQAWRERLPNMHDDIDVWSDLVSWRQNVFHAINKSYMPIVQAATTAQSNGAAANSNTAGYRGYHETAWIINRFAHVARKHNLLDVCFSLLNKIYTLPNIEISEAFLKLREQARCHFQNPNDMQAGLDVINNTNLNYFSTSQKAEFCTLKGMFHAALGRNAEASDAFSTALHMDATQGKAWAEWGKFSDTLFHENNDIANAANAVQCYLQAAGIYKNRKSRGFLARVLWLLSVDDSTYVVTKAFDTYKGDAAFWYWITLIPQLCSSISHREVKQARYILLNIAKLYPQALFFHLRTTREEMAIAKRQAAIQQQRLRAQSEGQAIPQVNGGDVVMHDAAVNGTPPRLVNGGAGAAGQQPHGQNASPQNVQANQASLVTSPLHAGFAYIEDVVQILKTAFPLLILSMETMVDQIVSRFKGSPDEEAYRLLSMLLQDAMQQFVIRVNSNADDGGVREPTIGNLQRMTISMPQPIRKEFEDDFLKSKPSLNDYIRRLQSWRDRYEKQLDARPRTQTLDMLSHYLTEFQYAKFDDIEVPGQYTEARKDSCDKDSNQNFARILKFGPMFENCRAHGHTWKRFTMHGSDNSVVTWAVQLPANRHTRREERMMQLLRQFNEQVLFPYVGSLSLTVCVRVMRYKKECRKRNLHFHVPTAVSCNPASRLIQIDSSYVTFGEIYEQHCQEHGTAREDPILIPGEKVKVILREFREEHKRMPDKTEYFNLKKEMFDEIQTHMVPDNVMNKYFMRTMASPQDLWLMRKQFTAHLAAMSFITYMFSFTSRMPSRFLVSRKTGQVTMSEMLPGYAPNAPIFQSNDIVPFRVTPNLQQFMGPVHTEGILATAMFEIGRNLSAPEYDIEKQLALFSRDEVVAWLSQRGQPFNFDLPFRQSVQANIAGVIKRLDTLSCKIEREQAIETPTNPSPMNVPVTWTVVKLIGAATDPVNLMKMTEIYMPWF
ncbi:FAT-domain-containing protein [Vararia minispora EC-137]|uniref:FAT-domain-containing protein n=1 Tax=Vararia minispora EC-137 TaxID=1314806 RepID=A0ACB8Q932_9AGAM|nr:FAT-domain-containing protein [Vararia minispora EC-137]